MLSEIQLDGHSNEIYKSLVFGRIRIHCADVMLSDNALQLDIWRKDADPSPKNFIYPSWFVQNKSQTGTLIEQPFVFECVPGTYDLRRIGLAKSFHSWDRFAFITRNAKELHLAQHIFQVPNGSMTYLGTIDIDITNLNKDNYIFGTFSYSYTLRFENNINEDSELPKKKYPDLFNKYKDKIVLGF